MAIPIEIGGVVIADTPITTATKQKIVHQVIEPAMIAQPAIPPAQIRKENRAYLSQLLAALDNV